MLYRVRIGEDEYLGTADEVVAFMARAEGAPGRDARSYMEGVARRLEERMGLAGLDVTDAARFLDALDAAGVVPVQTLPEPSDERADPREALGEGPVVYGPGVEPGEVDRGGEHDAPEDGAGASPREPS
jgi:hypothetical protein